MLQVLDITCLMGTGLGWDQPGDPVGLLSWQKVPVSWLIQPGSLGSRCRIVSCLSRSARQCASPTSGPSQDQEPADIIMCMYMHAK